jgi:hypothetical protein
MGEWSDVMYAAAAAAPAMDWSCTNFSQLTAVPTLSLAGFLIGVALQRVYTGW